ncbi:hypothetical protein GLYMA_03G211300v4 [Glycine max]|uniref:Uncharacterized protein n=2 Tax=Glycine subgen. Soja TaxID=1462606 RepID=A0A0R0KM52_SOYBN|nr:hypothetical protein JHK87_007966 [Glycine soja]KAH1071098.1 hypothetical protein GYH30_007918 [Glycine max]KRH68141.1 hypothetical protein GLYMA_03G211300v4 [Glycine max]RZC21738.1 hypothetical protein D0Y65_007800 [Glycine soja]
MWILTHQQPLHHQLFHPTPTSGETKFFNGRPTTKTPWQTAERRFKRPVRGSYLKDLKKNRNVTTSNIFWLKDRGRGEEARPLDVSSNSCLIHLVWTEFNFDFGMRMIES